MVPDEFYAPKATIKSSKVIYLFKFQTKFKPNLKTPFILKSNEQSHIYETVD